MTISTEMQKDLEQLERRLKIILPEQYQDCYEELQPVSMGSAGLKIGADGQVLWNEMWASFCDLAMAGGPPHKGALLQPGAADAIAAQPAQYQTVVDEICRGIALVTELPVSASPNPGWVRVECLDEAMAEWLLRAITMENVAVRREGSALDLPAAPGFRLEKEIKNVITVIAKTCHYWVDHTWDAHQALIGELFVTMSKESPLIEPSPSDDNAASMAEAITQATGMPAVSPRYVGWLGIDYANVQSAVWMMRALVASNVLSRREGTVLFVPVNPITDPGGRIVVAAVVKTHRMGTANAAS